MVDLPPVWPGDAHTFVKHTILEKYLGAWYAKLGQTHRRIVFVDGFAGPGIYEQGQRGSPLVALDAALNHKADLSRCQISLIFIESDEARFEILTQNLSTRTRPSNVNVYTEHSAFEPAFSDLLAKVDGAGAVLAPAFVMIDPFGWTGFPHELIARLGRHPQSEVLVSFMYEGLNRFVGLPEQATNMDRLFGCPDWRKIADAPSAAARRDFLVELYRGQLGAAGFTYSHAFELADAGNRTEYFLIHGTKHLDGLAEMKRAMWSADSSGQFRFSDWADARRSNQLVLFGEEPQFDDLQQRIRVWLEQRDWVDAQTDLREFVLTQTPYLDSHYKSQVLAPMAKDGVIEVTRPKGRRSNYWNTGTRLRLRPPEA